MNGYLHMQQEGSPYAIEVNTAMLPRLMAEIAVGTKAGQEVGGLLIGSFPRTADVTIRIDDFVVIGRRDGDEARYNLTPEQRARLSSTRHERIRNGETITGFFRSHLSREGLVLSSNDRKLLSTEFGKAIYAALVIRGRPPYAGGFTIPDAEGVLPIGGPPKELQFNAEELGRLRAVSPSRPSTEATPEPTETKSLGRWKGWPRIGAARVAAAALWVALIAIACLMLTILAPFTASILVFHRADLQLTATEHGGMVEVRWNQRQHDIARAAAGMLSIMDGSSIEVFKLDGYELRTGSLAYRRKSSKVAVRLTLKLPDGAELTQSAEWVGKN